MVKGGKKQPTYEQRERLNVEWWAAIGYSRCYWRDYNMKNLQHINAGRQWAKVVRTYNDIIIMADTETSKSGKPDIEENHIVAWTISARTAGVNLFTLYGQKPSEFCECINMMISNMHGQYTLVYFHNLAYDYVFLRKFLFRSWGYPERQLNTKPHYPVSLEFNNGVILRDSLILAQRSLEKWADDLDIEHKKAVGSWDYNLIRHQSGSFTDAELHYIEHDTLAGVECIDALRRQLKKNIWTMPYTATGIPREDVRKLGKGNRAKDAFSRSAPDLEIYQIQEQVYHGGYTHANRHQINWINPATCYDFASEYPFCMLSERFPLERFTKIDNCSPEHILKNSWKYGYMFKLIMVKPDLKSDDIPMPALQFSKCSIKINAILDNGRILAADYVEIYITEQDLSVIMDQYNCAAVKCVDVYAAEKSYLPRWLTDYIFQLFHDKTMLKGGDPVAYALAKAKLNSVYGLTVQKWLRDNLQEDFETGEYIPLPSDINEDFDKYINNKNNILLYQIGVWVTAYAFHNIFALGKCIDYKNGGQWLYTDTDSCYGTKWNMDALNTFNDICKQKLQRNGYGPVIRNGREYWPGIAEFDGLYSEFVSLGAKRYACRDAETGQLKITVAGVPKKTGAKCLKDDIRNFKKGFVFDGLTTGKLTHTYIYTENIHINEWGDEVGDSINLTPCDYLLDDALSVNWDYVDFENVEIQVYD